MNTLYTIIPMSINGYIHYRLWCDLPVAARWLVALGAMDIGLISLSVAFSGGFDSHYFIFYYLALAVLAVVIAEPWFNFSTATIVAVAYLALSLFEGSGFDEGGQDEKVLIGRLITFYAVVALVVFIARFERTRGRDELGRERDIELHLQRVELSQANHDTTAQSVYMIGLGIEIAIELADKCDRKLVDSLETTHALSKSAMWELRYPIDIALVFEDRAFGQVLQSDSATYSSITSVPAEVCLNGVEPPLSAAIKSGLYSVAHKAMSNAYRHSSATKVTITLDFEPGQIRMSVSDNGTGLPENYADHGHGFRNMRNNAESIGGSLEVRTDGPEGGAVISCLVPYETASGG